MVLSPNMAALLSSSATTSAAAAVVPPPIAKPPQNLQPKYAPPRNVPFPAKTTNHNLLFPISCFSSSIPKSAATSTASTFPFGKFNTSYDDNRCWMVLMEAPPQELVNAKSQIIDYYVSKLEKVLGSEKEAQMCIYDASCDTPFGFCCDIDHEAACELASMPGVLSVKPDPEFDSTHKDYSFLNFESVSKSGPVHGTTLLFPTGTTKHWLVRMERPPIGVTRRAQVVDYYVQVLMRVLRNEKDAQMCLYHISWQSNYGFCCELDDNCAQELAAIPSVLLVEPDENFRSDDKGYGGENSRGDKDSSASSLTSNIKTKKLFVTGLSFYTSEKTLRAAFEGFGELVEVKIIMDKISKRSKGYGFLEYTTEEAASTALREMNGKIINGWMITVDVAKKNPPNLTRVQPR